ncbi:HalOD1 output domain-containing protein [Natrinema salinisoli]|uniref:HalOD1 output domain-containing protein n=1 Tax=Natrinema salinisoli TaxID=2878535 RepID=UPI001CF02AFB|nr:HalOD1 output domain-containing protein [Natrinema salinisoli]
MLGGPGERRGISTKIIEHIAKKEGTEPVELPPLYEAIDPDLLERLFAPKKDGAERPGRVEFQYNGYTVIAEFDEELQITTEEIASAAD